MRIFQMIYRHQMSHQLKKKKLALLNTCGLMKSKMDSNKKEIYKLFDDFFDVSIEKLFNKFKTYMSFLFFLCTY
jgi:hypothetical protein